MTETKTFETNRWDMSGQKDCWPLYRLQSLPPNRFAAVVAKIMDGRYVLVNGNSTARAESSNR